LICVSLAWARSFEFGDHIWRALVTCVGELTQAGAVQVDHVQARPVGVVDADEGDQAARAVGDSDLGLDALAAGAHNAIRAVPATGCAGANAPPAKKTAAAAEPTTRLVRMRAGPGG
jgi:hypothetical protein